MFLKDSVLLVLLHLLLFHQRGWLRVLWFLGSASTATSSSSFCWCAVVATAATGGAADLVDAVVAILAVRAVAAREDSSNGSNSSKSARDPLRWSVPSHQFLTVGVFVQHNMCVLEYSTKKNEQTKKESKNDYCS